ncbi:MAG: ATP-binding protein, partial [Bacteroidota bacterium]
VINITPERLWCSFDRDKLEQIVYNLLGNAFKFTPDGKKITFKSTHAQEKLNIDVSDTGIGIAENDLPHIFNRFYQVDDSYTKERSGSGIGLALTKELVNFMEGTIEVKSDLGKGSEFLVTLPMDKIRTSAEGESPDSPLNALAVDHKKVASDHRIHAVKEYTVLVVEDNNDMRYFIKEALEDNYTIIEANNGKTGLVKATKENPDIIIADIMMPKMDGLTLVKKLKTQLETSHIPVVLLTAKAGMENKLEGLELGADEYLTKPFDGKELNVRIRNLVASRKKLRALFASKNDIEPEKITVTSIDQRFMEQLKQLFEERYAEAGFGVPEMQNELGMGKTQLYRKLKSITDCSPGELLRNFRLKRAAQLLEQNSEHITQIAYSVGFNSLSYFTRRFKEFYRISPSEYANNTTDKRNQ